MKDNIGDKLLDIISYRFFHWNIATPIEPKRTMLAGFKPVPYKRN
jgi:hypothetical protein